MNNERIALSIAIADLSIFVLFGFLFFIPVVVVGNMIFVPVIFVYTASALKRTKGRSVSAILAFIITFAILYVNFMMIFGNKLTNVS